MSGKEEEELFDSTNLNLTHYIAIMVVYSVALLVFLMLLYFRHGTRKKMMDAIPHRIMPMLRPGEIALVKFRTRKKIIAELVRESEIEGKPTDFVDQERFEETGHFGWGAPGTEHEGTHFKTSISRSYRIIEKAALRCNEAWSRERNMSIREYMYLLCEVCPYLPKDRCEQYVCTYEVARYSPKEFTAAEWRQFRENLLFILQAFSDT